MALWINRLSIQGGHGFGQYSQVIRPICLWRSLLLPVASVKLCPLQCALNALDGTGRRNWREMGTNGHLALGNKWLACLYKCSYCLDRSWTRPSLI